MLTKNLFSFIISASNNVASNVIFTILFALCSVAVVIVFVWLLTKYMGKKTQTEPTQNGAEVASPQNGGKLNFTALMAVTLIIGFIVRLIFTFIIKGYRPDFNKITELMQYVNDKGLINGYYSAKGTEIFPLTYYIFAFMGSIANMFGLAADSVIMPLFVKLPFIICDILTAYLLYKIAKKYINNEVALIVAAFVCICPIFIFASGVWGSVYSILVFGVVLCLYFLVQKNFAALIGVYGACLLISKDAIFLMPLVGVFVVYSFIKALKASMENKVSNIKDIFDSKECSAVLVIPISLIATTILMYVVTLPLLLDSFGGNFFKYIAEFFLKPLDALSSFGRNSLSIFNLFMRNGVGLDAKFPSILFTVIFGIIILGIVLLIYLSKKNRANLVYLAAYIFITLATYFVDFTELSLLPALGILLLSYLLIKDKRILQIFGVLSLVMVINSSIVMASANFLNNLDDSLISTGFQQYANLILSGAGGVATSIICSVFAILAHLYATLVLLDISMSNKRKLLIENPNEKFLKSISDFIKVK